MTAINWSKWVDANDAIELTDEFCKDEQKLKNLLFDLSMCMISLANGWVDTQFYPFGRRIANQVYEHAKKVDDGYFMFMLDCFRSVDDIKQTFVPRTVIQSHDVTVLIDNVAEYVLVTRHTIKMDFEACMPFLMDIEKLQESGRISIEPKVIDTVQKGLQHKIRGMNTKRVL